MSMYNTDIHLIGTENSACKIILGLMDGVVSILKCKL
jgi:hypothetical protein